jgi:hypothetical protein
VATTIAHQPSGTVHCQPIHPDYTRVKVISVKEAHKGYEIDCPTDDGGLTELRECEGNFKLWHKKDIVLNTPSPAHQGIQDLLDTLIEEDDTIDHATRQ